jgi:subtilisin-like proprotein convertase family protein
MKRILLFVVCMIAASLQVYSQCTTTNATSCACKDGTTNCDLLPDIIVARPPLLVNGSSGYVEYPQVCTPSCSGNDGRLRVSVSTPNVGFGPLEVRSTTTAICGTDTFYNVASNFTCANGSPLKTILNQRVYHKTGNVMSFQDRYAGTMTYHPSHGHMHVDDWGIYTLRTATSDPNPLNWPVIGTGSKLAFCLMDYGSCSTYNGHCVDSANNTMVNNNFPNYGLGGGNYGCSASVQGISSGYTDIYYQSLDGMWINLPPGLCNGTYWMVVQLDPYNYFLESNENNNVLAVQVNLTQQGGTTPVVSASGSTTFCQGGSVSLTATSGASHLWSNGATTQSITVTQSGNYSVTVSNGNNCSATSAATVVNVSQIPVTATASTNNTCSGQSVSLTSTATSGGTVNVATAFSNTSAFNIPDNNITGISSPINVSGIDPATINSNTIVSVRINISHTYTGDLIVQLVSPSQNTINLSNRRGGSGDNFNNTLFTANASIAISAGSAPFAGTYRPDGLFSALTGNVNGTWLLKVSDRAGNNIGTLNSWTLTLNDVTPTTLSYNWSSLPSGFSANTQNATASPTATTTYTVVATESGTGCTGSNSVTVQVGNTLNVTTNTPAAICAGQSTTLSAGGATSYSWSPATGLNTTSGSSVVASPAQTTTYMVVGTVGNCSDTSFVTVNINQLPVVNASNGGSVCQGGSATLSASGATSYSWSPSTGLSSATGSSVTATPSQTTTYTVTGTSNGCSSTAQVTVNVNFPPIITVSSNTTICPGTTTSLTAGGASTFTWSPSTGLNSTSGASVSASPASTTTYTVVGTAQNGCTATSSVTVNVSNALNVTTNTPADICSGQSVSITASGAGSFSWSPSAGLNTNTGSTVVASPSQTSTYMVIGTDGNCSDTSFVTVTVNALPVITASVANAICQGGSTTISASGASSYTWSPATALSATTGSNVTASPSQNTVYTVTGTANGCSGSTQVTVTVHPNPIITVSSSPTICAGQTTSLIAGGAATFSWNPSTGLDASAGSSVNASPSSTTTYTVTGTTIHGCTGSNTVLVSVNPLPGSIASVSGTQHYCLPMNGAFAASQAANATSYAWTAPAGMTITSGQGTANATITASTAASGDVCVTASNACGSSAAVCRSVSAQTAAPTTPGTVSGVTKACPGETRPFSVAAVARASFYSWTLPAGTTLVSGAGTNSVSIQFNSGYNGGTISVVAGNGCGNSPARTKAMSLNTPATPAVMNGSAAGVCNSIQTYSVTPVAGLTYNWTAPSNATILSGQGTSSVQIQFLPAFLSGNVSVTASNTCGTSTARVKAVKAVPAVPTSITGATSVCKGQTGVAYSTAPVAGATTYTWTIPSGTTLVSGQGTTNIVLNFALNASNSSLRVKAGNSCATSTNRTLNITVNNCPKISDFTSKQQAGINLLPNPASTYVEVQFNSTSDARAELRINNILGQIVLKQFISTENGFNNYMIDLRKMTKGVYVISILQDGKSYAQRLVIE